MAPQNEEPRVKCPIEGCGATPFKRGAFMHVWQTDGKGHGPRGEVPEHIDVDEFEVVERERVDMDFPDTVDIGKEKRLDTYTGKAYQGERGLMIHLGQMAGKNNIPEDVTERLNGDEFPVVRVDEDGNIIELIEEGSPRVPDADPYLPDDLDDTQDGGDSVPVSKIRDFIERVRNSTGAATADTIEEELLGNSTARLTKP